MATVTNTAKSTVSVNDLRAMEAKTAEMRATFEKERNERLSNLHTEVGYENTAELIAALKSLAPKSRRGRKAKKTEAAPAEGERKERVVLTAEQRASLVADLVSDKFTNEQLAAKYNISPATVQNIKKQEGLVKATAASPEKAA